MDGRIALTPGYVLELRTEHGCVPYTIKHEIGRGGSCIVYDASYTDNVGNYKLVRIKECYPYALHITRDGGAMLRAEPRDSEAFLEAKTRMREAYQKNHELFYTDGLTNAVSNTSNIYETNGTVYIVSVYIKGQTFSDLNGESLHDCAALVLSTAKILKRIHEANFLYLDLKPDNILLIDGSLDLVQLFDFDSMIPMDVLSTARQTSGSSTLRASYTKGFAPLEQQTGKMSRIGKHSDLYSLGAVFFYALWHRTPSAADCEPAAVYDFSTTVYAEESFQDALYPALTEFFHKTLASYYPDRYQNADEAIEQLRTIIRLSDVLQPWIRSTQIPKNGVFYGRGQEIETLCTLLQENQKRTVNLHGMGGIGKSTLVRQYIQEQGQTWNTVLWLYDQGQLQELVADDLQVNVNTIRRLKEESSDEYFDRKIEAISKIADEQKILLVIDNFQANHLEQLKKLQSVGWTILLISRERLPEELYPSMFLQELEDEGLVQLFSHYAHLDMLDKTDIAEVETILSCISGHTLLAELIARQIAKSYLDLSVAEAIVTGVGLFDLPQEKIDYIRDQTTHHATLLSILDQLVDVDQFTGKDKICMKLLSLFDMPGIEADLFKRLTELDSLDFVNDLETLGWIKMDGHHIYLHPMMQEYIQTWPWTQGMKISADKMMANLYERVHPAGTRHDSDRQFPSDYERFYQLLRLIPQIVDKIDFVSEPSQRLLYRWLMDAPVDQDIYALMGMLDLLEDPKCLDDDCVLRLFETAAYYRARLYIPDDAIGILKKMRQYLRKHPSAYYLSAYHRAMAVILHNANRDLKTILYHEDKAISAARISAHPEARKQLATCLMSKAGTLMSVRQNQKQVHKLMKEAETIVEQHTEPLDYERYHYHCNAAMCSAMDGDARNAQAELEAADRIVFASPDSDLSVAEHLIEETAPIRMELEQYELAEEAVLQAISICENHKDARRYRETVFDAYYFLGRIYELDGKYINAKDAYDEAENRVHDSPFEWTLPLCPEDVARKAIEEAEREDDQPG